MKKRTLFILGACIGTMLGLGATWVVLSAHVPSHTSDEASVFAEVEPIPSLSRYEQRLREKYPDIQNWVRPEGPYKVALQVGHWKNNELPDELDRLRGSSLGASGGGTTEWRVGLDIAEETKELLEAEGIVVELLPATIPPGYWADLLLAIHADGSPDTSVSGFKAAGPRRDYTENADDFVTIFEEEYARETDLRLDMNITRNMRGYYAFNWFRYDHAMHPMTTGVILETGFLTNRSDQRLLINNPKKVAQGITNSVLRFMREHYASS